MERATKGKYVPSRSLSLPLVRSRFLSFSLLSRSLSRPVLRLSVPKLGVFSCVYLSCPFVSLFPVSFRVPLPPFLASCFSFAVFVGAT